MTADALTGIGGYRVERQLGAGGMGRVYLCRDESLDRPVAVKVLQPELLAGDGAEVRSRFLREARALARVSSPHVVLVHAVGEDPGAGPFVVMEYLEGEDLHVRLERELMLPWREVVAIARGAVAGLRAAESAGIVHRDIKPANLFVVDGKAKLTDFGLAREIKGNAGVTQAGIVVGTPAYLAPEVIKGAPASAQSDLYSLGATMFHLIAGRPPFTASSPLEVVAQAVREEPPLLSAVADVPAPISDLVARMLAKDPALRPAGFAALDDALAALLSETPAAQRTLTFGAAPSTGTPPDDAGASRSNDAGAHAPGASPSTGLEAGASLLPSTGAPRAPGASTSTGTPAGAGASLLGAALISHGDLPTMDVPMTPGSAPTVSTPAASNPFNVPSAEISSSGSAPRIKTAPLTVMMTDIAGYSERTSRVSREESARWLALHDQLLQPVFRSFGGKVVKTLGDAFLVTFSSPTDAVLCACAIQDRLYLHNRRSRPEDAIHVRVALSAGEVRLHKGDVFGEPVNLAARIEPLAQPGEVLISDAVYATMNAAEVKLVTRGEHTLKGISRPVVVYAAVADGIENAPPFGGRALSRVRENVVTGLVAAAPQALGALRDKRVLAAALGVLVVAGMVAIILKFAGDNRIARIDHGEARAVAEELEQKADAQRSGKDWLVLGHARLALDDRSHAFAAYKKAAEGNSVDDRMKQACLQALAKKDDNGAKDVLAAWPATSIDKDLRVLLASDEWWPRHHAMALLDTRKVITDADRQDVGLHDLASDSCGDRRSGVQLLKKYGKGDDVVDELKKLGADPLKNACLMFDLNSAEDAVKKR